MDVFFCYDTVVYMNTIRMQETLSFLEQLNTEQRRVVEDGDGACLVLAGAGSGKTKTITTRVAYLLSQGVLPQEILLVTFTNKAAREMIARVATQTKNHSSLPWAGTFHHIAFKILKQYAALLGYANTFSILDSDDSTHLLKLCIKQEGTDTSEKRFPSARVVQSIVSFARNAERPLSDILEEQYPNWAHLSEIIGRIAESYAQKKRQAQAMDFDDLLVNLYLLLLQHEPVRKKFATQFRYCLVDEYQDTNAIQASIMKLFSSVHNNILVVGDDAQSIYSFRAANIEHILQFEKQYKDARVFRLEINYRSTPEILAVANDVILHNKHQYEKHLESVLPSFVKPELSAFADQQEEASHIAKTILELRDEGIPLSEMAVLFRASFHSQALEVELTRRDIPYEYRGGTRFFDRAHIKDVLAFVRIFSNKDDSIAWSRILTMQAGIGATTALKIIDCIAQLPDLSVLHEVRIKLSARAQVGWADFVSIWKQIMSTDGSPASLILAVLESKYVEYLKYEYPDYRERTQDIEQLARFAEREQDVHTFLADVTLQEQQAKPSRDGEGARSDDEAPLVLSTIHQAKGLEWEVVFVMQLGAGQFPSERSMKEKNGIEEERRLFYVAVTRAKKQLYFSYSLMGGYGTMLGEKSMFLEEMDYSLIHTDTLGAGNRLTVFSNPSDDVDDIVYESLDEDTGWNANKKSFLKSIEDL